MEPNLTLLLVSGFLLACGVYLMLERSLTRILMGILLASNGVNLLFAVIAGPARRPAFVHMVPEEEITDPLPQAMVLTAIVITLATTAYMLAMAYRAVQVNGHDEVQDDVEDAVIRRLAALDEASESFDLGVGTGDPGEEAGGDFYEDDEERDDTDSQDRDWRERDRQDRSGNRADAEESTLRSANAVEGPEATAQERSDIMEAQA